MLRTWIAVGSTLALLTTACGGNNSGNDDAATGQVDAKVSGADASAVDAKINVPDGAVADCTPASGTTLKRTLVANFVKPVLATAPAGDPRLFIVEQPGRIRIVKNGSTLSTPFLDIRSLVEDGQNEQGLLGLAFHPNFATNGRFFVYYTRDNGGWQSVVAEYHASPGSDTADPTAVSILLTADQPNWNHNAGMLAFGPNDGYLYIGFGDGGGANDQYGNGQNLDTLLATILRIDVNSGSPYSVPATNPFVGQTGRDEIWAYGLRNPWRFSFDRQTGDLYIGDVGQNLWEEVDVQPAASTGGENYGWSKCEADHDFSGSCATAGLTAPVAVYNHSGGRCSLTGGYVYRGSCMPDLQGWYFYGDYCSGQIWRFQYSGGVATNQTEITNQIQGSVSSFGEDGTGELYIVNRDSGNVYRLELAP